MRIVIDTNVLISAFLLEKSIPSQVLFKALAEHTVLTSGPALREIKEKLPNQKFDKYVDLPTRFGVALNFKKKALLIDIVHTVTACRDFKDNKYLELALSGQADCIITGDQDLLILNPFKNIPIIKPREFLNQF